MTDAMMNSPFDLPPPQHPPIAPSEESEPIGPLRSSNVLAGATVVLMGLTTLSRVLTTIAANQRAHRWEDAVAGRAALQVATDANDAYDSAARLSTVLLVTTAITLAAWSRRIALNARARDVRTHPTWAMLAWFIPLFGVYYGIGELRRATVGIGSSAHRLRRWLYSMYVQTVFIMWALWLDLTGSVRVHDAASALDRLSQVTTESLVLCVVMAITAVLGGIAILHTDRVMSGRSRQGKILSMRVVSTNTWAAPIAPDGA